MNSYQILMTIKQEGFFTRALSFDQFVSDLCKRYTRIYGEILPAHDYDYIVTKLEEKGIIEPQEAHTRSLDEGPIYL